MRWTLLAAQAALAACVFLTLPFWLALGVVFLAQAIEYLGRQDGIVHGIEFMYNATPEQRAEMDRAFVRHTESEE